ncbi:hypothetical protein JHK85_032339 [Glycine max]|nr:hypothetical protein JHK85_032339 [Glycine max]
MTLLSLDEDAENCFNKQSFALRLTQDQALPLKQTVRSLIGNFEKEREHAIKLLLEFCNDEDCCVRIASEKGALVFSQV